MNWCKARIKKNLVWRIQTTRGMLVRDIKPSLSCLLLQTHLRYCGFGCSLFLSGSKKFSMMASTKSSSSFFRCGTSLLETKKQKQKTRWHLWGITRVALFSYDISNCGVSLSSEKIKQLFIPTKKKKKTPKKCFCPSLNSFRIWADIRQKKMYKAILQGVEKFNSSIVCLY